jgi:hypothetical protein
MKRTLTNAIKTLLIALTLFGVVTPLVLWALKELLGK